MASFDLYRWFRFSDSPLDLARAKQLPRQIVTGKFGSANTGTTVRLGFMVALSNAVQLLMPGTGVGGRKSAHHIPTNTTFLLTEAGSIWVGAQFNHKARPGASRHLIKSDHFSKVTSARL